MCNKQQNSRSSLTGILISILSLTLISLLWGCSTMGSSVVVSTATTIGVEMSQNQATQTPTAVLGYKRAEFAYVPTNRGVAKKATTSLDANGKPAAVVVVDGFPTTGDGAKDTTNVIMELRYSGIFDWGSGSGIYQRLAVGTVAVSQPGATLLFSKSTDGTVDQNVAKYAALAQEEITIEKTRIDKILAYVSDGLGSINAVTLSKLLEESNKNYPKVISGTVTDKLKTAKTASELKKMLSDDLDAAIEPLYKTLPADKQ